MGSTNAADYNDNKKKQQANKASQFRVTPAVPPAIARPASVNVNPPAAPSYAEEAGSYGGGGGGGGYAVQAAAAPVIVRPDLGTYLQNDFGQQQQAQENQRLLQDYDAQTARDRAITEADQGVRFNLLDGQLKEAGTGLANDMASRGILRSGLTFQGQDKINAQGATQRKSISDILTDFTNSRTSGRLDQEAKGRQAVAEARQKAIDNYNALYGGGV